MCSAFRLRTTSNRSEDGVSWAPVVEQEGLMLHVLTVEGDTFYAADGATIFSLDSCE